MGLTTTSEPGVRGWVKHKLRDTVEVIVGAVIGSPESAERLVLGMYDTPRADCGLSAPRKS